MKKTTLSFILVVCFIISIKAQQPVTFNCATDELNKELYKKYPERKKKAAEIETSIYEQVKNITNTTRGSGNRGPIRVIPVVVHIIHNNGPENISNIQVLQGVQDLNDAFRNQNGFLDPNGVDTEIEFCLAQRDPNGNATNGITRNISPLTNMVMENDDAALKSIVVWNTTQYLNIWLVRDITSIISGPGLSGYATLPSSHGLIDDGIVNEANFFGNNPGSSKVHVHEAGHYLGLFHTFGGGCVNNNCLLDGDKVCDTPPDNSTANVTCGGSVNTCNTDDDDLSINNPFRPVGSGGIGDQNDQIENHMDYGDIFCHSLFTTGQKNRMQAAVIGPRASLLQSIACTSPCTSPIVLSFTPNTPTTINLGGTVNFTSTTTGATNYNWTINGTSIGTGTNASNTFNTTGSYWVVLTANNNDPNCKKQDSVLIIVQCTVTATFTSSATSAAIGGSLTFTSATSGATSYQWYIDGTPTVTTPTFTTTFPNAGGFNVYLVACNASCCDTSNYQLISVGTCNSKEANIWYFGYNAGLDFNSGTPVSLTNSAMRAEEACATISDKNGQVLMYCDGQTLFDRNHAIMLNGNYLFGHKSTTMGALIVPKPGSSTIYYVFTCAAEYGSWSPFYNPSVTLNYPNAVLVYHIVDMSTNGGLGSVISKNQVLFQGASEKIVGVKHSNGTDIWIVTHDSLNHFRSNLITCNGLDTIPVISTTGFMHTSVYQRGDNSLGMMMISPNGKKIALNARISGTQLGDFNTTTGVVSNVVSIHPPGLSQWQGLAFSPDSKRLYTNGIMGGIRAIQQYNISLATIPAITASMVQLPTNNASVYTHLQLAPNGKIYLAELGGTSIHVVNNPNALGAACNLSMGAVVMGGTTSSRFGLPNFLVDFMAPKKASKIQGNTVLCANSTYYINTNCGLSTDSIAWILNGNSTIVSTVDSAITLSPGAAGTDTLISLEFSSCGVVSDTLLIQVSNGNLVALGNDTTICGSINLTLNAGAGFTNYLWSTTATTSTINITSPGTYWVQVSSGPCVSRDTIVITQTAAMPNVNLGTDKIVCPGNVVTLNAGAGYQTYTWIGNVSGQTYTALVAGTYWVTVTDFCGNSSSDTINVIPDMSGSISLGNDTIICNNQSIALSPGSGYVNYLWSDSSSVPNLSANTSGAYWVQVTDSSGCTYRDTLTITIGLGPTVNLGNDTTVCNFTSLVLNAGSGFANYLWSSNGTNSTFSVSATGQYWVQVTDSMGCTKRDTINIIQAANVTTGTPLTLTCATISDTISVSSTSPNATYSWAGTGIVSGGTTNSPIVNAAGTYTVTVTDPFTGCTNTATITVTLNNTSPNVVGSSPLVLNCANTSGTISATSSGVSYSWSGPGIVSGGTTNNPVVNLPGTYTVTVIDLVNGCTNTASVIVSSNTPLPNISSTPLTLTCNQTNGTISANSTTANVTYSWTGAGILSGGTTQTPTVNAGTYTVTVTDPLTGCFNTATVTVNSIPGPTAGVSPNVTIFVGQSTTLTATGGGSYSWTPSTFLSSATASVVTASPDQTTTYCVEITDNNNCKDTTCVTVSVETPCSASDEIYVPNAFSPNNDLANDEYCLQLDPCIVLFNIVIYDRWGEKVYESVDPAFCWDGKYKGKTMESQVFVYYINATTKSKLVIHKTGNISLIR